MALTTEARTDLLAALQPVVAELAEDLRQRLLHPSGPEEHAARARARALYEQEVVGEAFDVWLDLLGHRAAVMWVLRLVYVRVLEDRALIRSRLLDRTHQDLFERMAPSLGESAFLRWVFLDLAQPKGGLPELFSPQPAEVLAPANAHSRTLLALFRERDLGTGALRFDFSGERFDGQLLGDLYQELDPVVKERFALLQTPSFVRAFMLDRTLGEALSEWPADEVRVLDPACGSGHFLLDAFRRLVEATGAQHPDWDRLTLVQHALQRVVGLDLNDYAAALARARLVMTALELSGQQQLSAASRFQPQVYWADGLEQVERDPEDRFAALGLFEDPADVPRASLTPADTRRVLRPLLGAGFHVVVANPPYITEKDKARKRYHKQMLGKPKRRRYVSAHRTYSLGSPFTERCFQLGVDGAFIGIINSNSFAKREFGVPLVEEVLAHRDLQLVVDTSGAYIPGHGTPTILVFGRNRAPEGETFTAVLGKRGEPSNPADPSQGKVWTAIERGWATAGFDSPFVSTEEVGRPMFASHPWSLRGGGALALQVELEEAGAGALDSQTQEVGRTTVCGEDGIYIRDSDRPTDAAVPSGLWRGLVIGERVRDFAFWDLPNVVYPYSENGGDAVPTDHSIVASTFWRYRTRMKARTVFGKTLEEKGEPWFAHLEHYRERLKITFGIGFAFVATHNHFVLDRGGKVFNRSAPVIKLPATATEADHLALLGPLNSSTGCFWMKQVMFEKGGSGMGRGIQEEKWMERFEHDSTKLARFPLPPNRESTLPWARALDHLGHTRAADTVAATLDDPAWSTAPELRALLDTRRTRDLSRLRQMVGLQDELDWLCYRLYGLVDPELPVLSPEDTPEVSPGLRPFELDLALADTAAREALARGETPDDIPTAWFERHGWTGQTELPEDADPAWAALVQRRRALTAQDPHLQLLEAPVHKRRWYRPRFKDDEDKALTTWLLTRLEEALAQQPEPTTPRVLARQLSSDARFLAAAVVLTGSTAPDLEQLCADLMKGDAVAAHPLHRYSKKGLVKRRQWEKTWEQQALEDQGQEVKIKVPPKYTGADFLGSVAYPLRGKLDVPKERFVAHTEVPTPSGDRRDGAEALYAWAGWSRRERLDRLFGLLEELEEEGVPGTELVALYDLMATYITELARTEPDTASDLEADLRGEAGTPPTDAQLKTWLAAHPAKGSWT